MHKLDVAFCDTNETYGERFAAYLMEHKAKEFTVHLFPEPELFLQKIKNEKFDLVLLGSGFSEFGEQAVLSGMTVLILSENIPERLSEDNSYLQSGRKLTVIFKYQPMEAILHEMMVVTGGKKAGKESFTDRLTKLEIIGVYSPIGHEMQMPFSMVLSSVLAKQRRILYINLMHNSRFFLEYSSTSFSINRQTSSSFCSLDKSSAAMIFDLKSSNISSLHLYFSISIPCQIVSYIISKFTPDKLF